MLFQILFIRITQHHNTYDFINFFNILTFVVSQVAGVYVCLSLIFILKKQIDKKKEFEKTINLNYRTRQDKQ